MSVIMAPPHSAPPACSSLKILTLNCWGLIIVSKQRPQRMQALATYLRSSGHELDVICLQEVWLASDAALLSSAAAAAGLPHSLHFKSGTFGAGLLTLSRWPIVEADLRQYSAAGDPSAITCGDYYAAKGFGWARIATPAGPIDVINTHLHANYSHKVKRASAAAAAAAYAASGRVDSVKDEAAAVGTNKGKQQATAVGASAAAKRRGGAATGLRAGAGDATGFAATDGASASAFNVPLDSFATFRLAQMWELAQGVRQASCTPLLSPSAPSARGSGTSITSVGVILAGDLNAKPDSLEMALLCMLLPGLRDSWQVLYSAGATAPGPKHDSQVSSLGADQGDGPATVEGSSSSAADAAGEASGFTCDAPGNSYKSTRQVPERIDYVLSSLRPLACRVTLKMTPGGFSYSDHFAVQAELELPSAVGAEAAATPAGGCALVGMPLWAGSQAVLEQAVQILDKGVSVCEAQRSQAYRAALVALAVSLASLLTLFIPASTLDMLAWSSAEATGAFGAASGGGDGSFGGGASRMHSLLRGGGARVYTNPAAGGDGGFGIGGDGVGAASAAATALAGVGSALLALIALVFVVLAAVLGIKGLLADSAQGRALEMAAAKLRLAAGAAGIRLPEARVLKPQPRTDAVEAAAATKGTSTSSLKGAHTAANRAGGAASSKAATKGSAAATAKGGRGGATGRRT